jgi:uncharacterized protein (DUF697 family)/predicted GTPase
MQDYEGIIEQFFQKYDEIMRKMGRVNIMTIGKSGVGKSTLINSIFREEIAKTGVGKPVTRHLRKYQKEEVPVAIYDSKGLELSEKVQRKVKKEIRQEIENRAQEGIEENYIHVIWYCIQANSNRIDEYEIQWIKKLSSLCPVIIVLTQCYSEEVDEFYQFLDNQNLPIIGIQKTLAKPYIIKPYGVDQEITIPSYGLPDLIKMTYQVLPEAVKKALVNAQQVDINFKVKTAQKWATRYVAGAFGVGLTPLPFSDAIPLVTEQVTMLAHITAIFGISVDKAFLSTLLGSVGGVGGAKFTGQLLASNLLKLIPGIGTLTGGLINGSVAATITTALSTAYINVMKKVAESELEGKTTTNQEIAEMFKQQLKQFT